MECGLRILLGFGRAGASSYEEMYLDCAIRRLEGLGLEVDVSDPAGWDRRFDYGKYHVVAMIASCNPVKDPEYLQSLIARGAVGFIVFGAWNATSTLAFLGLLKDDRVKVKHQSAVQVYRTADEHFVTAHLQPNRAYDLGIKYVSCVLQPGGHTRTLLHVDGDAALLVHTKMRACVSHWTGDPSQHDQEAVDSVELTRRCILWAAGLDKQPAPTAPTAPPVTLPKRSNPPLPAEPPVGPSQPPPLPAYTAMPPTPFASLLNDLWRLIDNEELADVVFVFRDRRLYANQALLAIRCPFLRAWMDRERGSASRTPGTMLEIFVGDEICSQAFYVVLLFLYTTSIPPDLPPTTLLNVLVTAKDCGLEELKQTCEDLILGSVDAPNAVSLLIAAHQLQQTEIKEMTMDFIARHLAAVKATGTVDLLKAYPELMLELLKM